MERHVLILIMINFQRNDEILMRFDRVNSEKERLKNDIEELRHIRYPITGVQLEMLSTSLPSAKSCKLMLER